MVAPVTVRLPVTEVVAKEETPLTVNRLEIVVEPVTVKVLEAGLKVKLEEVATALAPLPKRISLTVKLAAPVPPLATGNWPLTCVPKATGAL